ncbi:MAG: hypothetical protein RBS49_09955 [Sphaerochaeta sp.]|jgi:hypothetical protein|nr:hypothetical protein [Sphaerochaeta sp.]MDX9916192.1 hypothetical protein [Sphaerochaeta sp.]
MNECSCDGIQEEGVAIETAVLKAEHRAQTADLRYSGDEVYQRMKAFIGA